MLSRPATAIAKAIKELVRVLRPAGKFVLTLDNPMNPMIWLRNGPLLKILSRTGIVPYQVGTTLGPRHGVSGARPRRGRRRRRLMI